MVVLIHSFHCWTASIRNMAHVNQFHELLRSDCEVYIRNMKHETGSWSRERMMWRRRELVGVAGMEVRGQVQRLRSRWSGTAACQSGRTELNKKQASFD